jgi:hypothetical protein
MNRGTFSVESVESLQTDSQLRVAVVRSKKLVAEAGDSSGTQRKGNVSYQATASGD